MQIAIRISEMTGCKPPEVVKKEHAFYEIPEQILYCEKILELGWKPEFDLNDGLMQTVNWYQVYLK